MFAYTGTVAYYNRIRRYGYIRPDLGGKRIFFHFSQGITLTRHEFQMPTPKRGDRISFNFDDVTRRATIWTFIDIRDRLNTLSPSQRRLARTVLGEHADNGVIEIWNTLADEDEWHLPTALEVFQSNPGPQGTFNQVLLWCRYYLSEHRYSDAPSLQRWPDMPRYSVRHSYGAGQWLPINVAWYTRTEAEAFAAYLRAEGRYEEVRILDLWPDAPMLSMWEARKVLARTKIVEAGDQVTWISRQWDGHPAVVARGEFCSTPHVIFDGHDYRGEEALRLRDCGIPPQNYPR
jgi:cold shock CspA family protein